MSTASTNSEVNIHLRARADHRDLIDRAATLVGSNRSQFMLASAIKEAKNVLLDQADVGVDAATFQKVLAWLDTEPSQDESEGIIRLMSRKLPWGDA